MFLQLRNDLLLNLKGTKLELRGSSWLQRSWGHNGHWLSCSQNIILFPSAKCGRKCWPWRVENLLHIRFLKTSHMNLCLKRFKSWSCPSLLSLVYLWITFEMFGFIERVSKKKIKIVLLGSKYSKYSRTTFRGGTTRKCEWELTQKESGSLQNRMCPSKFSHNIKGLPKKHLKNWLWGGKQAKLFPSIPINKYLLIFGINSVSKAFILE